MTEAVEESAMLNLRDDVKCLLTDDGKNLATLRCQRCPCVILRKKEAKFIQKQIFLPHMKKKSEGQLPEDGETLEDHWVVGDMFDFENVGFSNTVGTTKFLICADCEIGPIGWHDLNDKTAYYVALDRVQHEG